MRILVISHKPCWISRQSPTGYATDGGFPFQMQAISELFDETRLMVPCGGQGERTGEVHLTGHRLSVIPLREPAGSGLGRKVRMLCWAARSGVTLYREMRRADAVHTPIPGDIGTLGMLLAYALRKPLFVRHCGNWFVQKTAAEHFWRWFMEKTAGGRSVMLATGGSRQPPSSGNPGLRWIFSTSLTERELAACSAPKKSFPGQNPRLIIVCRQEREKGTGLVIESLPALLRQFPGLTLDVVGDGRDLARFRERSAALGLHRCVSFHGKVNHGQVLRLLAEADLFCYPTSASEGFPKVVLEALACGLPVVTTRVSVLPELIGPGCGVLLDEASPAAVERAVSAILADPSAYQAKSACARATAGRYSLENWRDSIGTLLQDAWGPLRANA